MVQQANDFTVQGKSVQGKLTSGENIADLGGLRLALRAFQATEQYKENKEIDGFTPMQRFFLAWYVHLYFVLEGRYGLRQCQSRGSHLLRFLEHPRRAQCWRQNITKERALQLLTLDPHGPMEMRCNGPLSNMPEFHEAFGIPEGAPMWRAADAGVDIW